MAEDNGRTGLTPGVEAAWGLRERPGRGPRRGLTVRRILDTALATAESEGIGALSMSRVAADLGVSTMALYRYVSSKDELLVLLRDAAVGAPPPVPEHVTGWRAGLAHWARAYREVLHRHLWVLRVPITGPPITPSGVHWMEQALRSLADTPLDEGAKLGVVMLVDGYVRSEAALMADLEASARANGTTVPEATAAYGELLVRLADPEHFPAVAAVLHSGVLAQSGAPDEDFRFGLERVLDGVGALIEKGGSDERG